MANFGFAVGDFIAVGTVTWNVYKACKSAGAEFEEIGHEVISLHTAIQELSDELENADSALSRAGPQKIADAEQIVKNCNNALSQLQKLLTRYKSLGTRSKKTWDRVRFGNENLQDMRDKLMVHTSALNLFLTTVGTGSLGRIEKKLDELIADVRAGRREGSVLTVMDDDEDGGDEHWNAVKKEVAEDGITKMEIEAHRGWIVARLREAIESGELQEQPPVDKGKGKAKDVGSGGWISPMVGPSQSRNNVRKTQQPTVQDGSNWEGEASDNFSNDLEETEDKSDSDVERWSGSHGTSTSNITATLAGYGFREMELRSGQTRG